MTNTTYGFAGFGSYVPSPPISGIPTPPSYATHFYNLQNPSIANPGTWKQCSGTACAGGSNTGSGSLTFNNASPSLSGSSMKETSNGNGFNTLYYRHLGCASLPGGLCSSVTNFLADFSFYIPSSTNHLQALEFDPDMYLNGYRYFMSMQCDHASNKWRFWHENNDASHGWITSSYACNVISSVDNWHRFQLYGTMDYTAHTYTYQSLALDNTPVYTSVNNTFAARNASTIDGAGSHQLNIEQQIDNNSSAVSNSVYYDNYNFTVW